MEKKALNWVLITTILFICVYIGIYIGRNTSIVGNQNSTSISSKDSAPFRYDLNTVSASALEELPHITPQIAENIIKYRRLYGDYVDVDELLEVDGITQSLYRKIKDYFTVGGAK